MKKTDKNKKPGLSASVERHLKVYFAAHEGDVRAKGLYGLVIREVEEPLIRLAMEACEQNQLRAAALLGLNRNTLRKKIDELGLRLPQAAAKAKPKGREKKA